MGNNLQQSSNDPSQEQKKNTSLPLNPILYHDRIKKSQLQFSFINSKQSSTDILLFDPVDEVKLQIPFHQFQFFWIDYRVYYDQMANTNYRFSDQLVNFQEFNNPDQFMLQLKNYHGNRPIRVIASAALDDEVFHAMSTCRYVERIIMFCQNVRRFSYLRKKYPKIVECANTSLEVLEMAVDDSTYQQNILFMLPEDTPVTNKYWINFYSLLKHQDRKYAYEHFFELALSIYPDDEKEIQELRESYSTVKDRQFFVKEWMFRDSFFWNMVERLPKVTNDPKQLVYLRAAFKDIHQTIENYYKNIQNEVLNCLRVVYIVIKLSDEEIDKIDSCLNNYMLFTSFVRGFTNKNAANTYKQSFEREIQNRVFIFQVTFPRKSSLHKDLDHGFILYDEKRVNDKHMKHPDIVFNIFNYFKITDISVNICQGILMYGSLADAYNKRENKQYRKQLKLREKQFLVSFDNMETQSNKIRGQVTVLRISGHISDAIVLCDSTIEQLSSSIDSSQKSDSSVIQIDEILLEKGDSILLTKQYDTAINIYLQVQSQRYKLIAYLRIVGIYLQLKDQDQCREYFKKIIPRIDNLKQWGMYEEYFRAKHFRYTLLMMAKNYGKASKSYKQLKEEIQLHYDYKNNTIPFWNEIINNMNQCIQLNINAPIL